MEIRRASGFERTEIEFWFYARAFRAI